MDRDTAELVTQQPTRLGIAFKGAAPVAPTLGATEDDKFSCVKLTYAQRTPDDP